MPSTKNKPWWVDDDTNNDNEDEDEDDGEGGDNEKEYEDHRIASSSRGTHEGQRQQQQQRNSDGNRNKRISTKTTTPVSSSRSRTKRLAAASAAAASSTTTSPQQRRRTKGVGGETTTTTRRKDIHNDISSTYGKRLSERRESSSKTSSSRSSSRNNESTTTTTRSAGNNDTTTATTTINRTKRSSTAATSKATSASSSSSSSSLSPTRQKLKDWTESGKSRLLNAVEYWNNTNNNNENNNTPKSVSLSSSSTPVTCGAKNKKCATNKRNSHNNNHTTPVVKWTCDACTYFNVRDSRNSTNTKYTITATTTTTTLMCEMCSTPYLLPTTKEAAAAAAAENPMDINRNNYPDTTTTQTKRSSRGRFSSSSKNSSSNNSNIIITKSHDGRKSSHTTDDHNNHALGDTSESTTENASRSSSLNGSDHNDNDNNNNNLSQYYSMSELIKSLNYVDTTTTATTTTTTTSTNNHHNKDVSSSSLPPALERRVTDFKFAQNKRREKYGEQKAYGIYGLYGHLSDIRADLEWAEDAAWRRKRHKPYLSWRDFDKSCCEGKGGSQCCNNHRYGNRPLFTYLIMILCTIMMVVTLGVNGWKLEPMTINPLWGPSSDTLIQCGARDTNLIVNEGEWYRLFTPMILHAGVIHYLVNMLALFFIGGAVEKAHGFASTAVLFLIPAVGGNIVSAICLPGFISVGASGGIFGLIGGCMADICLNWNLLFLKTKRNDATNQKNDARSRHFCVLVWLAMDIMINTLLGFTPFVDNFTHLGGFLYGFCIGFASIERLASGFFGIRSSGESHCSRVRNTVFRYFGLIVSIIAIMVTTVLLIQSDGVTNPCPGCRYISCLPFPPNAEEKWWYCDDCEVVTADLFQAMDGSGLYEQVHIHCPNGDVEELTMSEEGIYDTEVVRKELPSYCRAICDEVFASY